MCVNIKHNSVHKNIFCANKYWLTIAKLINDVCIHIEQILVSMDENNVVFKFKNIWRERNTHVVRMLPLQSCVKRDSVCKFYFYFNRFSSDFMDGYWI